MAAVTGERSTRGERAMVTPERPRSYYGLPIVKRPAWTWEVPWYLFTGGTAGALGAAAFAARQRGARRLGRRARRLALGGAVISPLLLISDLGQPSRFLNMLRVFRPTSPMSVGSWTLAGFGAAVGAAEAAELVGLPEPAAASLEAVASVLGPILASYTAVLLGDTANPIWRGGRAVLPFVFAGSSLAGAGGALCLTSPTEDTGPARAMVLAGTAMDQGAFWLMEQGLGELAQPYSLSQAGMMIKIHRASAVAGAVLVLTLGRRSRLGAALGGLCSLVGSAALRQAVFRAGFQAAEDPRYLVLSQE
ncbi:MAG: NrfD/PsrC family molybdoenzyme membrane anchor subunit [Candidatus Dormibacteria bacterium]